MKRGTNINPGWGISVPPDLHHVVIYFEQKNRTELEGEIFYLKMAAQKWQNAKGFLIKNWKQHAWAWILNDCNKKRSG